MTWGCTAAFDIDRSKVVMAWHGFGSRVKSRHDLGRNLRRRFPILADLPFKIESDQWGKGVMSRDQPERIILITRVRFWRPCSGCGRQAVRRAEYPVQTNKGVKAVDVVWVSDARLAAQPRKDDVAITAPEICVEVFSPRNRRGEIDEKKRLYFEKGAVECWTCDVKGKMSFFDANGQMAASKLCPNFSPAQVSGL